MLMMKKWMKIFYHHFFTLYLRGFCWWWWWISEQRFSIINFFTLNLSGFCWWWWWRSGQRFSIINFFTLYFRGFCWWWWWISGQRFSVINFFILYLRGFCWWWTVVFQATVWLFDDTFWFCQVCGSSLLAKKIFTVLRCYTFGIGRIRFGTLLLIIAFLIISSVVRHSVLWSRAGVFLLWAFWTSHSIESFIDINGFFSKTITSVCFGVDTSRAFSSCWWTSRVAGSVGVSRLVVLWWCCMWSFLCYFFVIIQFILELTLRAVYDDIDRVLHGRYVFLPLAIVFFFFYSVSLF